jgi:hypothetical protein
VESLVELLIFILLEVATHGREGMANIQITMTDNDLQLAGSRCLSKHYILQDLLWPDFDFAVSAGVLGIPTTTNGLLSDT